jgi:CcmD family protein
LKPDACKTIMMKRTLGLMMRSALAAVVFLTFLTITGPLAAQQPPSEPQEEFLPIDQLPPAEQLPAAPLLVTAYAFAWVVVFFYVWTVWRRLGKVEGEMRLLEKRQLHRGDGGSGVNRTNPR